MWIVFCCYVLPLHLLAHVGYLLLELGIYIEFGDFFINWHLADFGDYLSFQGAHLEYWSLTKIKHCLEYFEEWSWLDAP